MTHKRRPGRPQTHGRYARNDSKVSELGTLIRRVRQDRDPALSVLALARLAVRDEADRRRVKSAIERAEQGRGSRLTQDDCAAIERVLNLPRGQVWRLEIRRRTDPDVLAFLLGAEDQAREESPLTAAQSALVNALEDLDRVSHVDQGQLFALARIIRAAARGWPDG